MGMVRSGWVHHVYGQLHIRIYEYNEGVPCNIHFVITRERPAVLLLYYQSQQRQSNGTWLHLSAGVIGFSNRNNAQEDRFLPLTDSTNLGLA
jgi:hypothetical protein